MSSKKNKNILHSASHHTRSAQTAHVVCQHRLITCCFDIHFFFTCHRSGIMQQFSRGFVLTTCSSINQSINRSINNTSIWEVYTNYFHKATARIGTVYSRRCICSPDWAIYTTGVSLKGRHARAWPCTSFGRCHEHDASKAEGTKVNGETCLPSAE